MEHKPDETLYIAAKLLRTKSIDNIDFVDDDNGSKLLGVTTSCQTFSIKKEGGYYWLSLRAPGVPRQTVVSSILDKIIDHLE